MTVNGRDDPAITALERFVDDAEAPFVAHSKRVSPLGTGIPALSSSTQDFLLRQSSELTADNPPSPPPTQATRERARHLVELLARINTDTGGRVTEFLEQIADQLAAPPTAADRSLPTEEIAALREAGSFISAMPDPANRGSTRTAVLRQQLRRTALPLADVLELLNVKTSRIRQRVANRTLHAMKDMGNGRSFPAYQFTQTGLLPGWTDVGPAFPADVDLVSVAHFMAEPHPDLILDEESVSPREWLLAEQPTSVVIDLVRQAYSIP